MSEVDATNHGADDELHPNGGVDDAGLNADLDLNEGNEDEGGEGDDETEEFEFEGHKLSVPKALKETLVKGVLMHADYTRKTQDLADQRRAIDAERAAETERSTTFLKENAQLYAIREQLASFENVDWAAAAQQDAANGTQTVSLARIEMDRLKDAAAKLQANIDQKTAERATAQQQQAAKLIEARDAALTKQFPRWAEELPGITEFAKANGVTDADLKSTADPRIFVMLRYAKLGMEAEQRAKGGQRVQVQAQTRPATTVRAPNRTPVASSVAPEASRLSADEWAKVRNREIEQRRAASRRR